MRVLHIVNWYPTKQNPYGALWVKRQINSLPKNIESQVFHLEILKGSLNFEVQSVHKNHLGYHLYLPFEIWRLNEVLYTLMFLWILAFKVQIKKFDLLNVHIAYPLLTFFHYVKRVVSIPIVITEHWSAYHFDFNISNKKKLHRIKRIFKQNIPVITISQALGNDIKRFSESSFKNYIVPNIIDSKLFNSDYKKEEEKKYFFMISQWKEPKRPLIAIEAFKMLSSEAKDIQLIIAGYGPQTEEIKQEIKSSAKISFLGPLESSEIARYLCNAIALVQPSDYETFSVVCAEALACECPVIASEVGGIPEFVNSKNGFLVSPNTPENFYAAMKQCLIQKPDMKNIPDFSSESIGKSYAKILLDIVDGFDK